MGATGAVWRQEIEALAFRPEGHGGWCAVHRLAFRTLLARDPGPADCLESFAERRAAFQRAAAAKIASRKLPSDANFHLTSRDVERAAAEEV